ncbi:MAG: DUF1178 family protein [Alphaproteobacteria bacterium]|nr:DUF1178 family protein [Alphaproteobacteria bacterium]
MISLNLLCSRGHGFSSYFKSRAICDDMIKRSLVDCPHCHDTTIKVGLSHPAIQSVKEPHDRPTPTSAGPLPAIAGNQQDHRHAAIRRLLRDHVANHYENVGNDFAETARKIHYGEIDQKNIYGKMSQEAAATLQEEGIQFAPAPFMTDH